MSPLASSWQDFTEITRQLPSGMLLLRIRTGECERVMREGFPWRIWAIATFQAPDETGFPLEAEAELIAQAEREFLYQIPDDGNTAFLGNVTHGGRHVAVLYSTNPNVLGDRDACRIAGTHYIWDVHTARDADQEFLRAKFMLKPDETRHLKDREILDALARANDNNVVPRPITFYGLFPSQGAAQGAADLLSSQGFRTSPTSEMPGNPNYPWSLMFQRSSSTEPEVIGELSALADGICIEYGGYYDGWSCEPVDG